MISESTMKWIAVQVTLVIFFSLIAMCLTSIVPSVESATGPKLVKGYVYDDGGSPFSGANVTVNVRDLSNVITATHYYDASDTDGYYDVNFGLAEWEIGYTIEIIAIGGIKSGTNSTIATSYPFQDLNVTLTDIIPEFGGIGSLSLIIPIVAIGAIFLIARRRKLD